MTFSFRALMKAMVTRGRVHLKRRLGGGRG
jgi:hypothetical protein